MALCASEPRRPFSLSGLVVMLLHAMSVCGCGLSAAERVPRTVSHVHYGDITMPARLAEAVPLGICHAAAVARLGIVILQHMAADNSIIVAPHNSATIATRQSGAAQAATIEVSNPISCCHAKYQGFAHHAPPMVYACPAHHAHCAH